MGFGKSEQIYKEAKQQQLIHVEEEQTQQSQKQGQSQPEQMQQQKKMDKLENVMQKYQENASQFDLSEVKKDQSVDMEEQIVVTTSIHETKNAELILGGEQLSQKKQEQINKAEQEMKEETEHQESQEQPQTEQLPPAYRVLADLNQELQADTDSASPEFQSVKTTFAKLMEVMSAEHVLVKYQQDALFEARQAAVHYYNTHRGHRWSKKGKNRKDLVNRIIDSVQEAVVSSDTPELVKWNVLSRMMNDSSPEGLASKKTKEFAKAQVRKLAGHQDVDEYTYRYFCQIQNTFAEEKESERLFGLKEHIQRITTGLEKDDRLLKYYVKRYYVDEQEEPLTEQERQIKQKGLNFLQAMESKDLQLRKPFLDEAIQSMLDVTVDRKWADPLYLLDHYEEVQELTLRFWNGDNLFSKDSLNKQYKEQLPDNVKQEIYLKEEMLGPFAYFFSEVIKTKNIDQGGAILDMNFKKLDRPSFVKEFLKKGTIPIAPDPNFELCNDNPETYKSKAGYVKADVNFNVIDYNGLLFIEKMQNLVSKQTHLNLQEELRKAGMA